MVISHLGYGNIESNPQVHLVLTFLSMPHTFQSFILLKGTGVGVDIVNSNSNNSGIIINNKPVDNTTNSTNNQQSASSSSVVVGGGLGVVEAATSSTTTGNGNSNNNNNNNAARKKKRRFAADMQTTRFSDVYSLTGEILGRGAYGQVFTCRNIYTGMEYAVKIIDKYTHPNRERVFKEIEIYLHCRECPNILKIIEFFEGM